MRVKGPIAKEESNVLKGFKNIKMFSMLILVSNLLFSW